MPSIQTNARVASFSWLIAAPGSVAAGTCSTTAQVCSVAEEVSSVIAQTCPVVEEVSSAVEETSSAVAQGCSAAEKTSSIVEQAPSAVEQASSIVEETSSAADKPRKTLKNPVLDLKTAIFARFGPVPAISSRRPASSAPTNGDYKPPAQCLPSQCSTFNPSLTNG